MKKLNKVMFAFLMTSAVGGSVSYGSYDDYSEKNPLPVNARFREQKDLVNQNQNNKLTFDQKEWSLVLVNNTIARNVLKSLVANEGNSEEKVRTGILVNRLIESNWRNIWKSLSSDLGEQYVSSIGGENFNIKVTEIDNASRQSRDTNIETASDDDVYNLIDFILNK